jgi:hypothetical protein
MDMECETEFSKIITADCEDDGNAVDRLASIVLYSTMDGFKKIAWPSEKSLLFVCMGPFPVFPYIWIRTQFTTNSNGNEPRDCDEQNLNFVKTFVNISYLLQRVVFFPRLNRNDLFVIDKRNRNCFQACSSIHVEQK